MRGERILYLEPGKPMLFGGEKQRGITMDGTTPTVIDVDGDPSRALVHDPAEAVPTMANMLARCQYPDMPVPMGIFRQISRPTYGELLGQQIEDAKAQRGEGDLAQLVAGDSTWVVE